MASELKDLNLIKNRLSVREGEQRSNLALKEAIIEETKEDDQSVQGKFTSGQSD